MVEPSKGNKQLVANKILGCQRESYPDDVVGDLVSV